MQIAGTPYRTIWLDPDRTMVSVIDQTRLPWNLQIVTLRTVDDCCRAIRDMQVRGAPLIGAAAAWGMALAVMNNPSLSPEELDSAAKQLLASRPTAVNLQWAVNRMLKTLQHTPVEQWRETAMALAQSICDEDVAICSRIGEQGRPLIERAWEGQSDKSKPVNILTHCNAGWLATVDWGTALSPIYKAALVGIPVHVWVDETRPRNQGASLTAWELQQQGIDCTLIADNTGGHLMQKGLVDMCIVGSDRTTASGDVCNKIGTYLKALAAKDNQVPFYVALPVSTIDWQLDDGLAGIPIEQRDEREVTQIEGLNEAGEHSRVKLAPDGTGAANYAFDVTPARLVSGLITEYGIFSANQRELSGLKQQIESEVTSQA